MSATTAAPADVTATVIASTNAAATVTASAPDDSPAATQPAAQPATRPAITRIGVVGSGTMGAGIAELCALRGLDVRLAVSRESSLTDAPRRIARSLDRQVAKGTLAEQAGNEALARIRVGLGVAELADRQLVIEAVREDESVKQDLFSALGEATASDTLLATTTSSISVTRLAKATSHPERVLGAHFFNPVSRLPLVEVVPTLLTDPAAASRLEDFLTTALGRVCVRATDSSGFIVNALLVPYLLAAVRMVETGSATAEEVDRAMELGCAHPMGPLRLCDLIGLDVVAATADSLHAEFKQQHQAAPALLLRMVEAGLLGRKAGRGFYTYV